MAEGAPSPRLGARSRMEAGKIPDGVRIEVTALATADGASVPGILYQVEHSPTVVAVMHPRLDLSRHYVIPLLLEAGFSVWAQGTRSVGNDLTLLHEEAVLDAAAGLRFVRDRGFEHVVTLGPSGGATLFALYIQQASRAPGDRIRRTPGGRPIDLAGADLVLPDAAVFVAPHPGQGELLLKCIDGAVANESRPLSTVPELDMFSPANGFRPAPESSSYSADFVAAYRAAQRARIARIDAYAHSLIADRQGAKRRLKDTGSLEDHRASIMSEVITTYRTDADPRTVDLSLEPSDRPYGSIHGRRPDTTNFGVTGFGRLTTADSWLSTWSGLSSNARFLSCAPEVTIPSLFVEYTGDQATFPDETREMFAALAATDKTHERVPGTHFGGPIAAGERPGGEFAGAAVNAWLHARFPNTPFPNDKD